MTDLSGAIDDYLSRGWALVALHEMSSGACSCGAGDREHDRKQGGKHPVFGNWQRMPITDRATVDAVWTFRPRANVGIVTGRASGIFVLDIDPDNGGDERLAELVAQYGDLPTTYLVQTGSGGAHFYFAMPADFEPGNSRGRLSVGLDIRGNGGQVVAPPSVSGKGAYRAEDARVPVAQAPAWLLELIRPAVYERSASIVGSPLSTLSDATYDADRGRAYTRTAVERVCAELASAPEGARNETAFRAACRLHELANAPWSGLDLDGAQAAYIDACATASEQGSAPFPETEAWAVWHKAQRRVAGAPAVLPAPSLRGEQVDWGATAGGAAMMHPFQFAPMPGADPRADPFGDPDGSDRRTSIQTAGVSPGSLGDPAGDPADAMLAELVDSAGLDAIPELEPLIKGVLSLDTLARINGPSGHGKSFVTLDMAGHVGTHRAWHGRVVRGGPVLMVVAEGARGIKRRVRAWERHYGITMTGVHFLPRPVQAAGPEWPVLIEACRRLKPVLIVVDTQARVTVGVEENSATEMGRVVEVMEWMRRSTGACVLLVHHRGLSGEHGRGSSAVRGALQTELDVTKADDLVTIGCDKQKDDPETPNVVLRLASVPLGVNADGDAITGGVLVHVPSEAVAHDAGLSPDQLLNATGGLALLCAEVFATGLGGTKAEIKSVAIFERRLFGHRATFYRAWNELLERKIIGKVRGTASWRYVQIGERADVIEACGDAHNPGAYYAPERRETKP